MILSAQGDMFKSEAEALVNPVNTVGVMGAGLARQFKQRFPENYAAYKQACDRSEVQIGKMFVHDYGMFDRPRYVINFPTKAHWRNPSEMSYVKQGITDLASTVQTHAIRSLALPMIGCGLGGLDWDQMRPLVVNSFDELEDVIVHLYER